MRSYGLWVASALAACSFMPAPVQACGGFFCGQEPVDQMAERIVFAVGDDATDMIVQLSFEGKAPDFAWVLPVPDVPLDGSLDVFPQSALSALDAATAPAFMLDWRECDADVAFGAPEDARTEGGGGVTVHVRETVGPFETVVIEGTDASELVQWLRDNHFRVTEPMTPYIEAYVAEGNKLLALRLSPGNEVNDIQPFRLSLPGENPSIPIRITSVAAEPEMGILVFVLADRRYEPKNWVQVEVDDADVVMDPITGRTNWTALVAQAVDEAGGQGFQTELAEPTDEYLRLLESSFIMDESQEEAREALLPLLQDHPYITRMYTRVSAEEMISDPLFGRAPDAAGDVSRFRTVPMPEGMCDAWWGGGGESRSVRPCELSTCGAGGLCRDVEVDGGDLVEACACVPGATARTTFDPAGRPTVVCQDMRMSFLNPGDRATPEEDPLTDPCVGYDCGPGGECVPVNMTPTCRCDVGLVARGWIDDEGDRQTRCVEPLEPVPYDFYTRRLAPLPEELPGGREVHVEAPDLPQVGGGGCAASGGMGGSPSALAWLGLLPLAWAMRRRRRA